MFEKGLKTIYIIFVNIS